MDQQMQQQPPAQPAPAGQAAPKKSSKVWLWIIGGCLAIVIIGALVIGGLAWWGARKVKKAIQENQPKWEEMQKGAEQWQEQSDDWQKAAEEWQKEMEKLQEQMPGGASPSAD